MRRLVRHVAGLGLAAVVLVPAAAVAAAGNAPTATGWWTDQPGATAEPDGGFRVRASAVSRWPSPPCGSRSRTT